MIENAIYKCDTIILVTIMNRITVNSKLDTKTIISEKIIDCQNFNNCFCLFYIQIMDVYQSIWQSFTGDGTCLFWFFFVNIFLDHCLFDLQFMAHDVTSCSDIHVFLIYNSTHCLACFNLFILFCYMIIVNHTRNDFLTKSKIRMCFYILLRCKSEDQHTFCRSVDALHTKNVYKVILIEL